jgi:hypothetical protein
MSCVVSATFVVLINGETSPFFHSERGLRQGCPLSPLLFILIMESLSILLKERTRGGESDWGQGLQGHKNTTSYFCR